MRFHCIVQDQGPISITKSNPKMDSIDYSDPLFRPIGELTPNLNLKSIPGW